MTLIVADERLIVSVHDCAVAVPVAVQPMMLLIPEPALAVEAMVNVPGATMPDALPGRPSSLTAVRIAPLVVPAAVPDAVKMAGWFGAVKVTLTSSVAVIDTVLVVDVPPLALPVLARRRIGDLVFRRRAVFARDLLNNCNVAQF